MPCPTEFMWDDPARKCYTQLQGTTEWETATSFCKSKYPGSKLAEPRNEVENRRLYEITSKLTNSKLQTTFVLFNRGLEIFERKKNEKQNQVVSEICLKCVKIRNETSI